MKQKLRFGGVGALAAFTHYVVALLAQHAGIIILWANVIGFMVAFWISYFGHRHYTFSTSHVAHLQSLWRFFAVALLVFLLNEALLLVFVQYSTLPFWFTLPVIMLIVAVITFILSKYFVFQGNKHGV